MSLTPFRRVTANRGDGVTLSLAAVSGAITASTLTRTLAGPVVQYGVIGRTSAGPLKVAPGALKWPTDLGRVKLTREHARDESRGHLVNVVDDPRPGGILRIAARVADGELGDAALREANDRTRDGFSFDVVDAVIDGDTITSALVVAIGQVGIPAFDDMRIDTIAASAQPNPTGRSNMLTPEELAELNTLAAMDAAQLDDAQRARLAELVSKLNAGTASTDQAAAQGAQGADQGAQGATQAAATVGAPSAQASTVAASIPAVPQGAGGRPPATTQVRQGALDAFVSTIVDALSPGGGGAQAITAALADVTHSGAGANIEAPAWSGELWSGVEYEAEFTPLLSSGPLTNYEGQGWRFVTKPEMQDYAGDKAAVPSGPVTTEPSTYEAARMAVGHDIDRKFYDFPNTAFLTAYVQAVRESWAIKLDDKVRAYIVANAVDSTLSSASLLSAAALAVRRVKRARLGRASFVIVNDDDLDDLMDVTNNTLPAFLALWGIDPNNWVASPDVPAGQVIAGVRQAATVRTLPGSPIRVSAQHIANGGIDEAFFGYWAIETHAENGILRVGYAPAP